MPLRLAVAGIDHYHVTGWVESLQQFPDEIEIVALHDPDPQMATRLAPRFHDPSLSPALPERVRGLPFYDDLGELLRRERPELALVTLQNRDAPDAVERLAAGGVHVLVDKPGARNATEARRAFDAVHRSGVKASVGLTRHFEPAWLEARTLVAAGALGRVIGGEAFAVTSTVRVRDPANHLFDRDLSGHGILLWLGIHDVDGLLWLTGEAVAEVQAMVANAGGEEIGVEDAASVALRFRSGALATLHLANALPRPGLEGHVAIRGSLGSVTLTPDGRLHRTGPGSREDPLRAEERRYETTDPGGYGPGALLQIRDFLDVIRTGGEPRVTGRDLVRALEVIDAAYESAATGRRVPVR